MQIISAVKYKIPVERGFIYYCEATIILTQKGYTPILQSKNTHLVLKKGHDGQRNKGHY